MCDDSNWLQADIVELTFGGRERLLIGTKAAVDQWKPGTCPTISLRLRNGRWWVAATFAIEGLHHPASDVVYFQGVLFKVPNLARSAHSLRGIEASLPSSIEMLLCEGKRRSKMNHLIAWVNDSATGVHLSPFTTDDEEQGSRHGEAGEHWLRVGRGLFPIAVLPRHLLGAERGTSVADRADGALRRLGGLVSDLWSIVTDSAAPRPGKESQASLSLTTGDTLRTDWWQRLARLDHLVFRAGVADAWAALMAERHVRLVAQYPSRPLYMARDPVLSGPRGPWSQADGWSPSNPRGMVRERVVIRSGDTPPNRLALGFARRVLDELRRIHQDSGGALDGSGLALIAGEIRVQAENILHDPAFADVPRDATVPLDSPSLQLNARCRPLLDAWSHIDRKASLLDPHLGEVLLQPIARAEELYERWCHVAFMLAIRERITQLTGSPAELHPQTLDHTHVILKSGELAIHLLYTGFLPHRPDQGAEDDETGRWSGLKWSVGGSRSLTYHNISLESWSPVSRPDGIVLVCRGGLAICAHAWDAKYRPMTMMHAKGTPGRTAAGGVYQAHAFRDAVKLRFDHSEDPLPIVWSVVVHPGAAQPRSGGRPQNDWAPISWAWAVDANDRKGVPLSRVLTLGCGGVAIGAACPAPLDIEPESTEPHMKTREWGDISHFAGLFVEPYIS